MVQICITGHVALGVIESKRTQLLDTFNSIYNVKNMETYL